MVDQIVTQGRDCDIGGVIAARTGIVSIPSDFGTGRCLRPVVDQIVTQGRDCDIGGVIAARTGIVSIPSDFGAGSSLRLVADQIVAERGYNTSLKGVAVRAAALFFSGFGAGWSHRLRPVTEIVA